MAGKIRIINMHGYKHDPLNEILIKVDRTTIIGNPFFMTDESKRDEVCDRYEDYFIMKMNHDAKFRAEVDAIVEHVLRGDNIALGCWCAPKRCHAETILKYVEDQVSRVSVAYPPASTWEPKKKEEPVMFYCLVVGSREFNDYNLMRDTLDKILVNYKRVMIVSGGAKGADTYAERYAKERGYGLKVFTADWDKYGKSAGFKRNEEMHKHIAQFDLRGVVAFWDGKSVGTKQNFDLVKKYNNQLRTIVYTQKMYDVAAFGEKAKLVEPVKAPASEIGFRGERNYLSNMYPCKVTFDGITYDNAEAAFQAQKCLTEEEKNQFVGLDAYKAKALGRKVKLRPDWNTYRLTVMKMVESAKYHDNPELATKLKAEVGDIVENNNWGDKFWGVVDGVGQNNLGKILMELRAVYLAIDDNHDEEDDRVSDEDNYSPEEKLAIERLMLDLNQSGLHIMSTYDVNEWGMRDLGYCRIPYIEKSIQVEDGEYFYCQYSMERIEFNHVHRKCKKGKISRETAVALVLDGLRQ